MNRFNQLENRRPGRVDSKQKVVFMKELGRKII
jgi:hypothetical protein